MLNEALTTEYIDPVEEEPEILDFAQASSRIDAHILIGCHSKEWRSILASDCKRLKASTAIYGSDCEK